MSLSALTLVLLAGLIHACWNFAAKKAGGDARFAAFSGLIMLVVWAPAGIWIGIDELPRWGSSQWLLLCGGGVVHTLYFVTLLRGYRKADLTVVYPLARGSGPLLSSLVALVLLGEQISALGVTGIAGVVGGVFLIAGGPNLWRASKDPAQHERMRKGILYGLLTGALIACYTVVDGYAVKILLMSPLLTHYLTNFVRFGFLLPSVLRNVPEAAVLWKLQWKYALIVGVMSPVSYVLVLYAMQTAPLSHVAPMREVSMLFAALLGGQLLGEGERRKRLLGAVFIGAGVIALALG
jgi:drug/metabolite transporter (DMT)-like permease